MTHLAGHSLFTGVSRPAMDRLAQRMQVRHYTAGDIILRAGDASTELHGLVTGAARVELTGVGAGRRLVLVPPQSFGEMSALSGHAVSATIVAQGDTETWVLAGADLFDVLAEEPAFFRNVSELLGERLRHRTRDAANTLRPSVTLVAAHATVGQPEQILQGLYKGVRHYAPASLALDGRGLDSSALVTHVLQWRAEGAGAQIFLLLIRPDQMEALGRLLEPVDLVLWVENSSHMSVPDTYARTGAADIARLRLGERAPAAADERWSHVLDAAVFNAAAQHDGLWTRESWPELDRLVRQVCGREIGVALSVGAAAGLAHLGLLATLEEIGVPIDFLCGSSMGGAVAMGYAYFGNVRAATDALCRLAADFARSKGLQWMPRAGLVSPGRMDAITGELFGQANFADLHIPVAVVAADLVAGRPVVLDTGSLALAARATTAIPGLFPPVRIGNAILVDGGLVARVPADLMATRRSGLRLASLIKPQKSADGTTGEAAAQTMQARLDRPFGLRTALGASWSLLGWWDSAAQAQRADVVVRISTPLSDGFKFGAGQSLIECGRRAAQSHLAAIRAAVQRVLSPGIP
jgi:predicted acylesterase/phospholipase RssA/CRP-like cAMP-binding protein